MARTEDSVLSSVPDCSAPPQRLQSLVNLHPSCCSRSTRYCPRRQGRSAAPGLRKGPWMTKTPSSLLERLRQPFEPEAWGRFVSLYTPLIYSWGRRVGLQEQDAADLVQEVFVTLLQVLPTFTYDRQQSFRRWLRTITLNKWRNTRKQWQQRMSRGQGGAVDAVAAAADL